MKRTRIWMWWALCVSCAPPLAAQIQPGRIYLGGEQITDPGAGLTLTLPSGWRGSLSPDGEAFVLEAEAGGAYMVVMADASTEAEARAELAQPQDLGDGIMLLPAGDVREIASGHLNASYSVTGSPSALTGTVDVRLTPAGLGVAFVLLAPPERVEQHLSSMREFALSLGVVAPSALAAGGADEWEPYLRGRYLARFYTQTGYTESTELWLCTDGSFYLNDQLGGFGGGASGAFQGVGSGRWSATGAGATGTLLLDWAEGGRSEWALEYDYDSSRLYVNGNRMLRGQNDRCS